MHILDSLYSRQLGLYETREEIAHREELLESLQSIVRKSIKQILEAKVFDYMN